MFSSYGGISSRSKSTTDIFRASSANLDDASYPSALSYAHFRKNTNPAAIANSRRRRIIEAPVPPRRSSSSFTVNLDPVPYLIDDDSDDEFLESTEPSHVTVLPTQLTQSPGSKNFVKKLVATLERRQREQRLGIVGPRSRDAPAAATSELLYKKSGRNTVPGGSRTQELANRDQACIARFNSEQRLPATQLEDLQERDEDEDADEDWCDSADLSPQFWERDEERDEEVTTSLPIIHIIEKKSDSNNNTPASKSASVKRTIKNVLSSILNWKNSKSLPKGSREYYAARESLGEEMRAFRRDTMPRLMERATVKSKSERKRAAAESRATTRDEQREFSELIGSPISSKENSLIAADAEPPSIATIHPVYGSSSSSSHHHQRRSWHKQDIPADHLIDESKEVVYGSIKVQPPMPPPRASQLLLSPAAPAEPHLQLRPSKVRDLQKRISRESCSQVQLRRPRPAAASLPAACSNDNNNNNNRNSIVYDVPRSNRRVESAEETLLVERERVPGYISRSTPPEYENVSGIIGAHDDDKRLHCTAFTTF